MIMKNKGFTLLELMITLVILAILLAWAVPSFRTVMQNNNITFSTVKDQLKYFITKILI